MTLVFQNILQMKSVTIFSGFAYLVQIMDFVRLYFKNALFLSTHQKKAFLWNP